MTIKHEDDLKEIKRELLALFPDGFSHLDLLSYLGYDWARILSPEELSHSKEQLDLLLAETRMAKQDGEAKGEKKI